MQFNWWGHKNGPLKSEVYGPISWIPPLKYDPSNSNATIEIESQNQLHKESNDLQSAQSELVSGRYETAAEQRILFICGE